MKEKRRNVILGISLLLLLFLIISLIILLIFHFRVTKSQENSYSLTHSYSPLSSIRRTNYQCYGVCFCEDEENYSFERRSVRILSRLVYSAMALSTVTAIQLARNQFENECSQLDCPNVSSERISEVEHCEEVESDLSEEEEHFSDGVITLGSESSFKRGIFGEIFPEFERKFTSADIDEKAIRNPVAEKMVLQISHAKADKIIEDEKIHFEDEENEGSEEMHFLVTTDIITRVGEKILEKPEDETEAREMIRSYGRDDQPETVCGVVVVDLETGERAEGVDVVRIDFDEIPEETIDKIVEDGYVMKTCGALTIEDPRVRKYIKNIDGEEESVIGLPKKLTRDLVYRLIMARKRKRKYKKKNLPNPP